MLDGNRCCDEVPGLEGHLVHVPAQARLDDGRSGERRAVDDGARTVVHGHGAPYRRVAELGHDPDRGAHVPCLQSDLHVAQVLGHHADDGTGVGDAGSGEGLLEAPPRADQRSGATLDRGQLHRGGELAQHDDLLAALAELVDDRDADAVEAAHDDVPDQPGRISRLTLRHLRSFPVE